MLPQGALEPSKWKPLAPKTAHRANEMNPRSSKLGHKSAQISLPSDEMGAQLGPGDPFAALDAPDMGFLFPREPLGVILQAPGPYFGGSDVHRTASFPVSGLQSASAGFAKRKQFDDLDVMLL